MKSIIDARARARSRAVLESYQDSLKYLRGVRLSQPVLPAPNRHQMMLEAAIACTLRDLCVVWGPEPLKLKRVRPETDSLTLVAEPEGLADHLYQLIPVWDAEDDVRRDYRVGGVPGLRFRDIPGPGPRSNGVVFYVPGLKASVTVLGVPEVALRERVALLREAGLVTLPPDSPLTQHERFAFKRYDDGSSVAASFVLRHLGLFTPNGVVALDAWPNTNSRYSVQLALPAQSDDPLPELTRALTSGHYYLPLQLNGVQSAFGRDFATGENTVELDVRLLPIDDAAWLRRISQSVALV